jgi:uncharacterized protein DUF4079
MASSYRRSAPVCYGTRRRAMLRLVLLYLHPAVSLATVGLAGWGASLGLRSRLPRRDAIACRREHRRVMPWVYALVLINWPFGLAATWWGRPEIEAATSGHFSVGIAIVLTFTIAALLSRRVPDDPRVRAIHPVVGAAALLLCGVQIFLGLQLLP